MEKIKLIFTAISTSIAYIFGGMDTMLSILIIFMITRPELRQAPPPKQAIVWFLLPKKVINL